MNPESFPFFALLPFTSSPFPVPSPVIIIRIASLPVGRHTENAEALLKLLRRGLTSDSLRIILPTSSILAAPSLATSLKNLRIWYRGSSPRKVAIQSRTRSFLTKLQNSFDLSDKPRRGTVFIIGSEVASSFWYLANLLLPCRRSDRVVLALAMLVVKAFSVAPLLLVLLLIDRKLPIDDGFLIDRECMSCKSKGNIVADDEDDKLIESLLE
mmetsp:Transcript_4941/g.5737  ORF Transcript_4941/g.5737 Transcript_4941/m.5737 type:complete len:212 (-) Transcript_4941:573-1208(-)